MATYTTKKELIFEIEKTANLFIQEFNDIKEAQKDVMVEEIDRTPVQMIAYQQRLNDTWLTTNVMSQLATNDRIDSSKLKITTENATVYLMGMVTRDEGNRIANAVSAVGGIQRIVKVFDYMD